MSRKILVVGSANLDLVVGASRLPGPGETVLGNTFSSHLGGKGANQAVAAARAGAQVAMAARIGDDEFGKRLIGGLTAEGIDTNAMLIAPGPSGVALIVTAEGSNMIVVAPGANSLLTEDQVHQYFFADAGCILTQLEIPLDGVVRAAELARAQGARFILDPAPARELPDRLLALLDWITPNESEARWLLGLPEGPVDGVDAARQLRARGASGVIIKLGDRGVVLSYGSSEPIALPAIKVSAVDPTAAGDVFNGTFATALMEGVEPLGAARFAIAASAISVTRFGAQTSIPARSEIDAFIQLHKEKS